MYVPRFLQPTLLEQMASLPVVIVEGARAVGKTSLLRQLREEGSLSTTFTLTDPTQLAAASENPLAWLRSLPGPFAIDEAQLLPELPLALKALLDETNENVQCVLTGSAEIGMRGLGGTDPLARRASRLILEPLTEAELAATSVAEPWSVTDQLFDGHPAIGVRVPTSNNWEERSIRGGLPRYRVRNEARSIGTLHRQIHHDIRSLLTDDDLPGEKKDVRIAQDVLTHLLMHPGGELNITAISNSIGIDSRTVNRYIDILEQRFLLHEVANFHRPSKKSPRSTAKCYPSDSALSGAVLLATDRTMSDAATRGGMMEAHVVQQIKAHLGWGNVKATLSHWRENKNGRTSEVDLVLQDEQGRLVALEIKASSTVSSSHFNGIREFKNYYGERFHRGFVLTTGERSVAFDENLWSIPLSSLSDLDLWNQPADTDHVPDQSRLPSKDFPEAQSMSALEEAKIFVSYSHQDQDSSTGGDIRRFATDIVDALEGIHGRTARLFLDVADGRWGESLWSRLDKELQASTFLMPFITPRYLKSEGCRREFTSFSEATQRTESEQLLLPLVWISPPSLRSNSSTDPILQRLSSTRYLDVTGARRADRGSADYGNLVEEVAGHLEKVISERETTSTNGSEVRPGEHDVETDPPPGFDEHLAKVEDLMPQVEADLQSFLQDFEHLGNEFAKASIDLQRQSPTQLRSSMIRIGNHLEKPNVQLVKSAGVATTSWDQLITNLNRGISLYSEVSDDGAPEGLTETLIDLVRQLEEIDTSDIEGVAHQMPKMSSKLAPTSKALLSAVTTIRSMETSLRSWLTSTGVEHD